MLSGISLGTRCVFTWLEYSSLALNSHSYFHVAVPAVEGFITFFLHRHGKTYFNQTVNNFTKSMRSTNSFLSVCTLIHYFA